MNIQDIIYKRNHKKEYAEKCLIAGLFWLMVGCLALGWLLGVVGL